MGNENGGRDAALQKANDSDDDVKLHAVALPYPAQGHINPMMQLCKKLALRGFTITFVNTEHNHKRIFDSRESGLPLPQQEGLDIRMVCIPDGLPSDHPRTGIMTELTQATENMGAPLERLVEKLLGEDPPLNVIISDVVMHRGQDVANKFGLPIVALRTSNATSQAIYSYLPRLISEGVVPIKGRRDFADTKTERITCIPGTSPLHPSNLPSFFFEDGGADYFLQFALRTTARSRQASWLVVNSFYELERKAFDAMQTVLPIHAVGPLLRFEEEGAEGCRREVRAGTALWAEEEDCLQWLDAQPKSSVLYISFGSIATLSSLQVEELALGLDASQQPFLWVYRPDLVHGIAVTPPEEFLSRTRERCRIISWAPQLLVLSHPSVGAFLSHCGWNSCLESISMGVPIIAWPNFAEQRVNARLVVDEWRTGKEFEAGGNGIVARTEVERVVKGIMVGEEGREVRERATDMKEKARRAVAEGGLSHANIDTMVKDLRRRWKHTRS